jgi:hypothetical protein
MLYKSFVYRSISNRLRIGFLFYLQKKEAYLIATFNHEIPPSFLLSEWQKRSNRENKQLVF